MEQCGNLLEIRCVRHHGFLPPDPCFAQAWDKIPQVDEGDPDHTGVSLDVLSDRSVQSGYEAWKIVPRDGLDSAKLSLPCVTKGTMRNAANAISERHFTLF